MWNGQHKQRAEHDETRTPLETASIDLWLHRVALQTVENAHLNQSRAILPQSFLQWEAIFYSSHPLRFYTTPFTEGTGCPRIGACYVLHKTERLHRASTHSVITPGEAHGLADTAHEMVTVEGFANQLIHTRTVRRRQPGSRDTGKTQHLR